MSFKEYLVSTGVSEEQAQQIVDGMPEKDFHLASEEHLDVRFDKMKRKAEELEADLKTANETLTTLRDENKDVKTLQEKIDDYEQSIQQLESERADERKTFALKEALTKEGVSDVDYMLYKLGEVDTDEEGNIVDLDNKLKDLKESNPTFFTDTTETKADASGFTVLDNKLPPGQTPKIHTFQEMNTMTAEEINENWDAVSASLEKGDD